MPREYTKDLTRLVYIKFVIRTISNTIFNDHGPKPYRTYPFFVSHQVQISLGLRVPGSRRAPQGEAYAGIGPRHDRQRYDVLDDHQERPVSEHRVFRQVDVETVRPVVRVVDHPEGIRHRRAQRQANDPDERDHAHALSFRRPRATNRHKTRPLLVSLYLLAKGGAR